MADHLAMKNQLLCSAPARTTSATHSIFQLTAIFRVGFKSHVLISISSGILIFCYTCLSVIWALMLVRPYWCSFSCCEEIQSNSRLPNPQALTIFQPFSHTLGAGVCRRCIHWDKTPKLFIFIICDFLCGLCCKERFP